MPIGQYAPGAGRRWGILGTQRYDPFGTPLVGLVGSAGFTGEWQDGQSGLVHLRARWYDPRQGSFLGRDPFAGYPQQPYSMHPYQYAYGNPLRYTDPSERCLGWLWGAPDCEATIPGAMLGLGGRKGLVWRGGRYGPIPGAMLATAYVLGSMGGEYKQRQQMASHLRC